MVTEFSEPKSKLNVKGFRALKVYLGLSRSCGFLDLLPLRQQMGDGDMGLTGIVRSRDEWFLGSARMHAIPAQLDVLGRGDQPSRRHSQREDLEPAQSRDSASVFKLLIMRAITLTRQ